MTLRTKAPGRNSAKANSSIRGTELILRKLQNAVPDNNRSSVLLCLFGGCANMNGGKFPFTNRIYS